MWMDIRKKKEELGNRYVKSTRHTIQVDFQPFMDELAELCGCKPDLCKYYQQYMYMYLNDCSI